MGYVFLMLGIAAEGVGTMFLKNSQGFSLLMPTIFCLLGFLACNLFIARSLKSIKMGISYATWYGGGVMFAARLSSFLYHEVISAAESVGLGIVLVGIVVANLGDLVNKN